MMKEQETICFDFDGVINSYASGWLGAKNIPDPPVEGCREAIKEIRDKGYRVIVQSVRATDEDGWIAISDYLNLHDIKVDGICGEKPVARLYIDDRGFRFNGDWDEVLKMMEDMRTWYER